MGYRMEKDFDTLKAKKFLERRESVEKERREQERIATLRIVVDGLKELFFQSEVEAYLVGSITQPYVFYPHSDIDIVIKNFKDDRFDLWTQLETMFKRNVEIVIFENCHFQEHVIKTGYKVF